MTPRLRSTIWIPPRRSIPSRSRWTSPIFSRRRGKIILSFEAKTFVISRAASRSAGPHAFLPDNLEYQFGAPAHRSRRQIPQIGAAGCIVPAGNQMRRRRVSAETIQAPRLRACRTERAEGLSRRRRDLETAVRDHGYPHLLRQDRFASHLGGLRRQGRAVKAAGAA